MAYQAFFLIHFSLFFPVLLLSCFDWQEKLLQPDSYYVVWALAPTRLPPDHPVAPSQCLACGEETSWRWWLLGEQGWRRGGLQGKGGGGEEEAWELYFVMWFLLLCFLIVRLFSSPVPFLSLHQSARQAFVLQFKGASVESFMLM